MVQAEVARGRGHGALIEAPRCFLRALGVTTLERGDRFRWLGPPPTRTFHHQFGSEVEIIEELEAGGFAWEARVGSYVVARRSHARPSAPASRLAWFADVARVVGTLPWVAWKIHRSGPSVIVSDLRREAKGKPRRDAAARARLRRIIQRCDRIVPSARGCYRRALVEMALDAGAAEERLLLGLEGRWKGHAWLERVEPSTRFDAVVTV
jgi:hypothetical protein